MSHRRDHIIIQLRRYAVLKFTTVPTAKGLVKAFDSQIRHLINSPAIAEAIAENEPHADKVCEILAKKAWTRDERQTLLDTVDHLKEGEYEAPPP